MSQDAESQPLATTLASWALRSNVKLFRHEFEQHVVDGRCPFERDDRVLVGAAAPGGLGLGEAGVGAQPSAGIDVDRESGEGSPGGRN